MRAPASLPSSFARWPWDWRAIARKRPGGSSGQRRSPALSLWFSICLCSDIHDLILAQIKRQIIVGDPLGGSSLKGSRQGMPFVECNLLDLPICIDLNAPSDLQRIAHGALNAIL